MLVARPDIGILAVAAWTVLSLIFHAVRMVQAEVVNARTGKVVSWLG
jgi:hypothetical protein